MSQPSTTQALCEAAAVLACQAADVLAEVGAVAALVELTGVELAAATRRELETNLQTGLLALHSLRLGLDESRRCAP
jgi:phosphopantothenate synthetase